MFFLFVWRRFVCKRECFWSSFVVTWRQKTKLWWSKQRGVPFPSSVNRSFTKLFIEFCRRLCEQSVRGVFQDNNRCSSGMLTATHPVNLFPEKITQETLHDHHISFSIGGRPICNLGFADDIVLMGGSNGELQDLTNRLVDRATAYGKEVSTEKSKIMTNSTNISADISMISKKFQVPWSNPVQRRHLVSRSPHQNCISNGSNGQTKQNLAVPHYQLGKEVQALQVSCHLPPQWGATDAEIKVPSDENTELKKVLHLKPRVGQYIAIHATLTGRDFFLANFYPSSPFTCIFSKTFPEFFLC